MSNKKNECTAKVHPGLRIFFSYNLYKSGLLYRDLLESHLEKFDLLAAESAILHILNTGAIVNQLTLGQEMGIDKASIVKFIDKLENLKLVKREVDAKDRRSKNVSLTSKGKTIVDKMKNMRNEIEAKCFASFSKEDQAHMRRLIPQLLEVLMNLE